MVTRLDRAPRVRHPLDVVVNDVGVDNIPVEKPLQGLKVASYYGCLITRPEGGFDDPEYPQSMDRLMEALGAEAVDWPYKTKCCGGAIYMFHGGCQLCHVGRRPGPCQGSRSQCRGRGLPLLPAAAGPVPGQAGGHQGDTLSTCRSSSSPS